MKILLDECVDWRLGRELTGHDVVAVHQRGWSGIKNGELLKLASLEFDIFLTVDRNLSFQQSLPNFEIAVIVLQAFSNRLADLRTLVPAVLDRIESAQPGAVLQINK